MRHLEGFVALIASVGVVSSARGDLVYQSWTLKNAANLSANDLHVTVTNNDGTSEEPIAVARSQAFADPPLGEGTATVDWPSDNGGSVAPGAIIRVAMCNESPDFLPDFAGGNVYFTRDGKPVDTDFVSIADAWTVDGKGNVTYTYRNPAHLGQGDVSIQSVRVYENNVLDFFEIGDEFFAFEQPTGELIYEQVDETLVEGEERVVEIGPSEVEERYVLAVVTMSLAGGQDFYTVASGFQRQSVCLWDNDLVPDGFNGRATSPPVFPSIRVVDDVVVPAEDAGGWTLRELHVTNGEDAGWIPGDEMEVYIYSDGGEGCPGELLCDHRGPYERMATGDVLFDREIFEYWITFPDEKLFPGTYFIGSRFPLAGGEGSTYWMTSSGGEHADTPGCFSLDDGGAWETEGPGGDFAFKVAGLVNPVPDLCLWDNDLEPDGFNARATSPPIFPTIRIADDIVVPDTDPGGWTLQGFHVTKLEDALWEPGDLMEVYIYGDSGGACPGDLLETLVGPFERAATGDVLFNREVFEYWTVLPDVKLLPAKYFIGSRFPNGTGIGSVWWVTSTGGAHADTPACFTLDGVTWESEGDGWDHAFKVSGVVNEDSCTCQGDVNEDCEVTFDDILLILSAWGPCPGDCPNDPCPEDVDGDCEVTFNDILIALSAWGPCGE